MSEPIVLGIESTCDETAAAVVQGRTLISNVVASSMDEHARYGGVIPEIASRAHAEAFVPCVSKALADANMTLSDVDAIAVSAGPGLAGCLAVGVSGAKSLAWAANKPIYGINHVIGHIAVTQLQFGPFPKDTLALIVSGGHTSLLHVEDVARHIDVVGTTLDDAAGECFDKVARLLGFPYPGGPHIDRHAQLGNPHAIKVPQGLTQGKAGQQHPYDFSFSGVKTAVARWIEQQQAEGNEIPIDDVVVGDIVHLSAGDMIPADVRIIEAKDLFVSQASLTGESEPVEKVPATCTESDSATSFENIALMGSSVISGSATALVFSVGEQTLFGSMASSLSEDAKSMIISSIPQGATVSVEGMDQSMTETAAKVKASLSKGGEQEYTVKFVRSDNHIGWAVSSLDMDFSAADNQ